MRRGRSRILMWTVAAALAACSSDDGGTQPAQTGGVSGSVVDAANGDAGVPGATVTLSRTGAAARTAQTGGNGAFALSGLEVGGWTAQVAAPAGFALAAGEGGSRAVTVAANQTAAVQPFRLQGPSQTGTIAGSVTAAGAAVANAAVTLTGGGTTSTNAAGQYTLSNVPAGNRTVSLTVPTGFALATGETAQKTTAVTAGQTSTVNWTLVSQPGGTVVEIRLSQLAFAPAQVTIQAGTRVRWVNDFQVGHTITPRNTAQQGVWQRAVVSNPGQTFEHVFTVAGQTYDYFCEPHEAAGMTGRIVVQ